MACQTDGLLGLLGHHIRYSAMHNSRRYQQAEEQRLELDLAFAPAMEGLLTHLRGVWVGLHGLSGLTGGELDVGEVWTLVQALAKEDILVVKKLS